MLFLSTRSDWQYSRTLPVLCSWTSCLFTNTGINPTESRGSGRSHPRVQCTTVCTACENSTVYRPLALYVSSSSPASTTATYTADWSLFLVPGLALPAAALCTCSQFCTASTAGTCVRRGAGDRDIYQQAVVLITNIVAEIHTRWQTTIKTLRSSPPEGRLPCNDLASSSVWIVLIRGKILTRTRWRTKT